jgi:methylated-DNA-[protein]-cysteine S-methyltransferase
MKATKLSCCFVAFIVSWHIANPDIIILKLSLYLSGNGNLIIQMEQAYIKTPLGICLIEGDAHGVSKIHAMNEEHLLTQDIPDALKDVVQQLEAYFNGDLTRFDFRMNPTGTNFQKKVWQALLDIPFGKTMSYQELSIQLGDVKAIRAVAAANGKNPLWIAVPCHRVIGSDGSLTGYAGGLWRKKWLLEHETPPLQQSLF